MKIIYIERQNTTRRNRETGTLVNMFYEDFLETWVTQCVDHGGWCEHPTKRLALSWRAHPKTWCQGCQEVAS